MKAHPAADVFPMLSGDELKDLADDIKAHGLHEEITTYRDGDETLILDGRNRLAACELAGVEPKIVEYTGDNPWDFVWSMNRKRRHLNGA